MTLAGLIIIGMLQQFNCSLLPEDPIYGNHDQDRPMHQALLHGVYMLTSWVLECLMI